MIFALVKVISSPAGTNDIRAIKAPVEIPNYWFWFWLILLLLAVMTALVMYLRWRKNRPVPPVPVIVIPPHVRAREKLAAARQLISQPKPFTIAVSDAIRIYLEERFDFRAPERTTEEFIAELQSTRLLSEKQRSSLGDFLSRCDLVKFARYEPGLSELEDLFDAAMRLVDETKTAPEPVSGNAPSTSQVMAA